MKGSAIIAALILIVISSLIVGGYLSYMMNEVRMTKILNDSTKALYIAEAGLEQKFYEMNDNDPANDFNNISTPVYFPVADNTDNYYTVTVVPNTSAKFHTVTSTGYYHGQTRSVRKKTRLFSLWDNAIFSGESAAGQLAGCMNTRGTVVVLGEESYIDVNENGVFDSGTDKDDNLNNTLSHIPSDGYAIDATGNFYIGNNYDTYGASSGIPSTFDVRIPSIFDSDLGYETLFAELNVKYGKVNLGASVQIGNDDQVNGLMDGANVPDGYNPSDPVEAGKLFVVEGGILSDRNMFSDKIRFPNLADRFTDSDTGTVYNYNPSYNYSTDTVGGRMEYLRAEGLKLTTINPAPVGYTQIPEDITPGSTIAPISDSQGNSFSVSGGNININGIVYIYGNLTFDRYHGDRTMTYTGRASMAITGNLDINVNLYTQQTGITAFPQNNIIGFMTPGNIAIGAGAGATQLEIMGIFYSGGVGTIMKPNKIAGSFLAHQVTLTNPPDIFQVKNIKDYLPPGMIDIDSILVTYGWEDLGKSLD